MIIFCPICNLKTKYLYRFNDLILVNNFIDDRNKYPLALYSCNKCDLIRLGYFHPDHKLYNENYLYSGQNNKQKTELIEELYKISKNGINKVLEIGGGDGYLYKIFSKKKCEYTNYDPTTIEGSYNIKDFYSGQSKKKYDLIIVSNVLAHIDNPTNLLNNLKDNFHEGTKFIFIVQNGEWVVKEGIFDYIFHEHKFYYSVKSFKKLLTNIKVNIYKINIHGESLLATNIKINKKITQEFLAPNKKYTFRNFKLAINFYLENLEKLKNKIINLKEEKIYAIGCAPRSIKLLYDLDNQVTSKIISIIEPKNSRKINSVLPFINIKINYKNEEKICEKNKVIWLPWHIPVPKNLNIQNIILPFKDL